MSDKMKQTITKNLLRSDIETIPNLNQIDPSCFNDPVALKTEWIPSRKNGPKFRTHNLAHIDSGLIKFTPAIWHIFRHLFIPLVVIVSIFVGFKDVINNRQSAAFRRVSGLAWRK
ncbi:hypothetical protein [Candidatus Electronema sp. JM]|uniref:hypothetical protein n=1 Tax=Candidatus Electronema sp. JM TaxID=3401571 RepID=UPI003AA84D59